MCWPNKDWDAPLDNLPTDEAVLLELCLGALLAKGGLSCYAFGHVFGTLMSWSNCARACVNVLKLGLLDSPERPPFCRKASWKLSKCSGPAQPWQNLAGCLPFHPFQQKELREEMQEERVLQAMELLGSAGDCSPVRVGGHFLFFARLPAAPQ